ncbi:ATP-binding protein [Streptomyces sp. NPDC007983]|uniref:ATP-binding protein n=1 Tax=Streptomyces sp. NPDC007983 TaxID=3364800 RepID=UPI0036E89BF5
MSERNQPSAPEGNPAAGGTGGEIQANTASFGGVVYAAMRGNVVVNCPPPPGDAPAVWLTPSAAFDDAAALQGRQHRWALRGREHILAQLTDFATASGASEGLGVLAGPAGQGKSRLLKALAETFESGGQGVVRVLGSGPAGVSAAAQLPPEGRLLVFIEDAHQRAEDLAGIIRGIRQERPEALLLFSVQPSGWALLRTAFRQAGVDHSQVPSWELEELSAQAAAQLAAEVLGTSHAYLARRLAAAVGDCPFLLVFSAVRIADGRLDPRRLESDAHLRQEVLDAFIEEALAGSPSPDADRGLLGAVAALQPFRLADSGFLDVVTSLLGGQSALLRAQLDRLTHSGVLTRRGNSLRILPDLLGDVLLAEAAVDPATGISTGYLEQILAHGDGTPVVHALVNASRLDWQWSDLQAGSRSPVEELWRAFMDAYAHSEFLERRHLLGIAEQIAPYQPRRVLELVRLVTGSGHARGDHPVECLPPVLAGIAQDPAHLGEALELLWLLDRDDLRPPAQHPDAALRVLSDLACYAPGKPLLYQHAVVDAVARWAQQGPVRGVDRMPFALLDPLFAPEAMQQVFDGRTLSVSRLQVAVELVAPITQQAYEVLLDAYGADDGVRAGAAARSMQVALEGLWGHGEQTQAEALEALAARTRQVQPDPVVALAVRRAVHWHVQYGSPVVAAAARGVVEALPGTVSHRLAIVLYSGWHEWLDAEDVDVIRAEAEWRRRLDQTVADLVVLGPDAVWAMLRDLLADGAEVFPDSPPAAAALVQDLVLARPAIAAVIVREAPACGDLIMLHLAGPALAALWSTDAGAARQAARRVVGASDVGAQAALQASRARLVIDEGRLDSHELSLAHRLSTHHNAAVRAEVMGLATGMLRHPLRRQQGIKLLCSVSFADVAFGAEAFGWAFVGPQALSWTELTPPQRAFCQAELVGTPTLRGHRAQKALAALSATHEDEALDVLMRRVEAWENDPAPRAEYEPLPYRWSAALAFGRSSRRGVLLRRLRQWLAADRDHPWRRELYGGDLFATVADNTCDADVREVIAEAVCSGEEKQIARVTPLLARAPRDLVWEEPQFITDLLIAAARHSQELYRKVGGSLFRSVTSGVKTTSFGQPYPRDLDLRDRAAQVRATLPPGSPQERLYAALEEHANTEIHRALTEDLYVDLRRPW